MAEQKKGNPQTEAPSESIGKFRAKINVNSNMRLRDQNRAYFDLMGIEALKRQMKLSREEKRQL